MKNLITSQDLTPGFGDVYNLIQKSIGSSKRMDTPRERILKSAEGQINWLCKEGFLEPGDIEDWDDFKKIDFYRRGI